MDTNRFHTKITSLEKSLSQLESAITKTDGMYFSYNEAAELLGRKPSVISQYVKSGLMTYIQQGPRKLIAMEDFHLLKCYLYLTKNYGLSYTACKMVKGLLKRTKIKPENYFDYLREIEKTQKISMEEKQKHVNSYESRGLAQKKKNRESE